MLSPRVITFAARRSLHTKPSNKRYDLIGPPDPVSHLRPVIYDSSPVSIQPQQLNHPYSLAEFSNPENPSDDLELQYKLQRQQLDAYDHNFWLDTNTRFEGAKAMILEALPEHSTPLDKEHALSEFYRQWLMQESERTDAYTAEWRRRNFGLIVLGARVEYRRFCKSMAGLMSLNGARQF